MKVCLHVPVIYYIIKKMRMRSLFHSSIMSQCLRQMTMLPDDGVRRRRNRFHTNLKNIPRIKTNLVATSSGVSSISSTQLTESCFSTTPFTAGSGGVSGAGEAAGEGGESGGGEADRSDSPDEVRVRIGGRSMYPPPASRDTTWK